MLEVFLLEHSVAVRIWAFVLVLGLMSSLEAVAPRRPRRLDRWTRWPLHAGLVLVGALVGRILTPLGAAAAAVWAAEHGWGLLVYLKAPAWLEWTLALVALDLAVFGQHVVSHRWGWLWRLHRLHHRDLDLDATSGVRFHPLELGVSILWKAAVVLVLGPSLAAVVLFEVLLNVNALFNHANLRLPQGMDRVLRWAIVTPDMHRVHHSVVPAESRCNFGFAIAAWDRLFGTYLAEPAAGQLGMTLGVEDPPST